MGGNKFRVSGFRFQVAGSKLQVAGSRLQILRTTHHVLRTTFHAIRNTQYALRNTYPLTSLNIDLAISLLLFATALYAYTATLAPTVIEGDAALFQFTPHVLGVTYPTGFPLYILLGKLWLTIFPFGEVAWRMNLLSALCSAAALPLVYNAARRLINYQLPITNYQLPISKSQSKIKNQKSKISRWAALLTVLTFATLPTFWRWSTEAKTYGLNILLFSGLLYLLARALENKYVSVSSHSIPTPTHSSLLPKGHFVTPHFSLLTHHVARIVTRHPLALPSLFLGLMISVHNTGVLLIPGYFTLVWLHFRRYLRSARSIILHLLLLALPGLFYLYIPLRAEWLIARFGRQEAIQRGLLADFYHSGLDGLIRYFTGVGFTEGVVSNWGLVPGQLFTVYLPLLSQDFTTLGLVLGVIGGLGLAFTHPRLFLPLFLMYAVPIPFVIVYGQGEQSAFLLPSFLIFALFVGNALPTLTHLALFTIRNSQFAIPNSQFPIRNSHYLLNIIPPALLLVLMFTLILPQIRHNTVWLNVKWNRDIYNQWVDTLNHPLEPDAGMLAHWGDLTSFWYMQHAEQRRPDLYGIYPPTEEVVVDWLSRGNDLYIAGPLQGWAEGIQERYRLIPWGRLVRIAPRQADPQTLLPHLAQPVEVAFGDQLLLLGVDYDPQAVSGHDYPITLAWRTLAELPPETTISLRLSQNGLIVAQLDERLRSGWFPSDTLPAEQHVLSYARLPVPLGTLPGPHRLQLVVYNKVDTPWTLPDGSVVLELGEVEIVPPAGNVTLHPNQFKPLPPHDFSSEIELVGYNYSVTRVGQGKGFGIQLMWLSHSRPTNNYTLLAEALDAEGNVLRAVEHQPVDGRAPTASWQPSQFVRDQVDLVLPASAPPGEEALQVQLSWLRPDGSKLSLRRWRLLPWDTGLKLGWLTVTEKKNRSFDIPAVPHPIDANLENKVRLVGFDTSLPEASNSFQLNSLTCSNKGCRLKFTLYWQGLSEMAELYQLFFHVVDAQGQIVAQRDSVPGRGKQPTTGWLPGEVITDPIEVPLPADLPAGRYSLRIGMYLPPTGPRLPILNESNRVVSDFIELGQLKITPVE